MSTMAKIKNRNGSVGRLKSGEIRALMMSLMLSEMGVKNTMNRNKLSMEKAATIPNKINTGNKLKTKLDLVTK